MTATWMKFEEPLSSDKQLSLLSVNNVAMCQSESVHLLITKAAVRYLSRLRFIVCAHGQTISPFPHFSFPIPTY